MALKAYEGMFLLDSNRYAKDPNGVSGQISEMIQNLGGEMLASRLWNEQRLAYPIKGHRKGTYWLTYFRIDGGRLRSEHGNGNLRGNTYVNDGEWHHCALTAVEGANLLVPQTMLYVDGLPDTVFSGSGNIYNVTADADVSIGREPAHDRRYINGTIDDVRIYDRALLQEEISWLAGRTMSFDEPF